MNAPDTCPEGVGAAVLAFTCERQSPSRVRIKVRLAGKLLENHAIDLNNANSRADLAVRVAARAGVAGAGPFDPTDIEAQLLALVDEIDVPGGEDDDAGPGFEAVEDDPDPARNGMYAVAGGARHRLTNFVMRFEEDEVRRDVGEVRRTFRGRIWLGGRVTPFSISPAELASARDTVAAVYTSSGPEAQFFARPELVCRAASALSRPVVRELTTAFGWDACGAEFLTPSARVDAAGVHPAGPDDPVRVDLSDEPCARHLDLAVPGPGELPALKRHVVDDLLRLSDRVVTGCLLAAAALAVLLRFAPGMNRPALWLVGVTGTGKSFLARLFANLTGDFAVADGSRLGSWTSTGNALQRMGWFFKDAIFLIDDFKAEVARHNDYVKLLQNYADGSARHRLRADATANVSRPIRGLLVSTGEDVPEGSSSALARNVVVTLPGRTKDLDRGVRCLAKCGRYRALHADFIRHLMAKGRTAAFAASVEEYRGRFLRGIEGRQNDLRIAGNLALLAAAFAEYAAYLSDAWEGGWQAELDGFVEDLMTIRDGMLAAVADQQPSEVFLAALRALADAGAIRIKGLAPGDAGPAEHRPLIGRVRPSPGPNRPRMVEVSTEMALRAVQEHLRASGRPPLAATAKALIRQMADDGKLLDKDGRRLGPGTQCDATWAAKLDGASRKVFCIASSELIDEPAAGRRPPPADARPGRVGDGDGDAPAGPVEGQMS